MKIEKITTRRPTALHLANAEIARLVERGQIIDANNDALVLQTRELKERIRVLEEDLRTARGLVDYERAQRIMQRDRLIEYLLCASNPATVVDAKRLAELQRRVAWPGEVSMPQGHLGEIAQRPFDR